MDSKDVTNLSILASAGTGKTFRLSDRIIQLLTLENIEHRNIAALTFTRAAAAEFIVKLVEKLQKAATDEGARLELCKRINIDPDKHDRRWFLHALRATLLESNRMTMGTLDSFFARLVRCFPLEVGIQTGVATTVSEQDADELRAIALTTTLNGLSIADRNRLLANLRDYADGEEIANPLETLSEMVKSHHEHIVVAPEESKWGNAILIWSEPTDRPVWAGYAGKTLDEEWRLLAGAISANHDETDPKKWPEPLRPLPAVVSDESPAPGELNIVLRYLSNTMSGGPGTPSTYLYRKGKTLDGKQSDAARKLLWRAIDRFVETRIRQTQALFKCLSAYERTYDAVNRKQGRLSFSDYVTLLTSAPELKQEEIGFRLDGSIHHWLLDEFQDTSTLQFKVLDKMIANILAGDGSEEPRSLFVVGDLKQSLYEWRSGNRKLLEDLNMRIKQHKKGQSIPLNDTRRCAQPVLELVNQTLTLAKNSAREYPNYFGQKAAGDWAGNFQQQRSFTENGEPPKKGESYWYRLSKKPGRPNPAQELADQAQWIAAHLADTPGLLDKSGRLRHGITCAILVSKNDHAAAIAEELRRLGIEASEEAKSPVVEDNPVTAGLAGIIRAVVHPDNGLQRGLAEISPASRTVIDSLGGWSATATAVTQAFHNEGAEAMVNLLIAHTHAEATKDAFASKRLRQFRALAVRYDGTGRRALGDFADYIGKNLVRDSADTGTIQVLTIHRSKGLEYDIVYLPCLNDSRRPIANLKRGDLLTVPTDEQKLDFTPKWLLANVGEDVAALNPALDGAVKRAKAESAYGSLCKLYVGMTRARHRLVMLTMTLSKDKQAQVESPEGEHDFASLLESQLKDTATAPTPAKYEGCNDCVLMWSCPENDASWLDDKLAAKPDGGRVIPGCRPPKTFEPADMLELERPSKAKKPEPTEARAAPARRPKSGIDPRELGNAVHALLEHLDSDVGAFVESLPKLPLPAELRHARAEAEKIVRACAESPAFRKLIESLSPSGVLWKEREMAVVSSPSERVNDASGASITKPGKYIFGKSDRIQIEPGKSAVIIDYKTVSEKTTDEELAEAYREQMEDYRKSVAKLCSLSADKIRVALINVRKGTVVEA